MYTFVIIFAAVSLILFVVALVYAIEGDDNIGERIYDCVAILISIVLLFSYIGRWKQELLQDAHNGKYERVEKVIKHYVNDSTVVEKTKEVRYVKRRKSE